MNPNELTPSNTGNRNSMTKNSPSTNTHNKLLSPNYMSNMPIIDENNSEYYDSNAKL